MHRCKEVYFDSPCHGHLCTKLIILFQSYVSCLLMIRSYLHQAVFNNYLMNRRSSSVLTGTSNVHIAGSFFWHSVNSKVGNFNSIHLKIPSSPFMHVLYFHIFLTVLQGFIFSQAKGKD